MESQERPVIKSSFFFLRKEKRVHGGDASREVTAGDSSVQKSCVTNNTGALSCEATRYAVRRTGKLENLLLW